MAGKFNLAAHLSAAPAQPRDIETVTADILRYKGQAGGAILAIGRCLNEAKAMLEHGAWTAWLEDRVEFSERTAQRFMRLANEWTNPTALSDLGASKALSLLAIPAEEREEFINTPHPVGDGEKLVADMTSRELEEAIRAKKDAEEQAAKLEQQLNAALAANKAKIEEAADELARKESQVEQLRQELTALRSQPVEVAVMEVDEHALDIARAEGRAEGASEMQTKLDRANKERLDAQAALQEKLDKALAEKAKAEEARKSAEAELESAKAKLLAAGQEEKRAKAVADEDMAVFKVTFAKLQEDANRLHGLLLKIRARGDEETAGKLTAALTALADMIRGYAS